MDKVLVRASNRPKEVSAEIAGLAVEGLGWVIAIYSGRRKVRATVDALGLLLGIFMLDSLSNHMLAITMIYLAPVWYAAQRGGRTPGMILCGAVAAVTSVLAKGDPSDPAYLPIINVGLRFILLMGLMLMVEGQESKLKSFVDLATTDSLTGVGNRHAMIRYARKAFSRPKDNIFVVMIDCDRFKELNDRYGHSYGDHVLIALARLLRRSFQANGCIARVGGDEFVAIVSARKIEDVRKHIERIAARLALSTEILDTQPTFSWGIAQRKLGNETIDELLTQADRDMYMHKTLKKKCDSAYTSCSKQS